MSIGNVVRIQFFLKIFIKKSFPSLLGPALAPLGGFAPFSSPIPIFTGLRV
jgi:hypothetical protein